MASPTQWTWVLVNSKSWWWTRRHGVLQSMGSQTVRHDWATELNWTEIFGCLLLPRYPEKSPSVRHFWETVLNWTELSSKCYFVMTLFWLVYLLYILGFFVCLFLFIFRYAVCRIFIPWPKIEPGLQQWKGQVLTSGLPGNSLRVSNGIAFSSINFEKYNAELRGFNFNAKDETIITKWKFLRLFEVNKS